MFSIWVDSICRGASTRCLYLAPTGRGIADVQENKKLASRRTGTVPFMAVDLLDNRTTPKHIERFDFESLFYLLLGIVYPKENENRKFWKTSFWWPDGRNFERLQLQKRGLLAEGPKTDPSEPLAALSYWLTKLRAMFNQGYLSKVEWRHRQDDAEPHGTGYTKEFDVETLDKHVTYDKIMEILLSEFVIVLPSHF